MVMGIDAEAPELAREYVAKQGYTFPTLVDAQETVVNLFHIEGWPTTIVVDREGKVVYYNSGHDAEKLRDALRDLRIW